MHVVGPIGLAVIEDFVRRCFGGGVERDAAGLDGLEFYTSGDGAVSRLVAKVDGLVGLNGAVDFFVRKDQLVVCVVSVDLNGGKCDGGGPIGVFEPDAKMDVSTLTCRPAGLND